MPKFKNWQISHNNAIHISDFFWRRGSWANWSFIPCGFYCRKQRIMLWPVHLDLLPSLFYLLATWSYWCLHSLLRISPHLNCICEEGNGNPLQCSCLENPRDGRASWAAVYEVSQSRTRLKQLSSSMCYLKMAS